MSRPSKGARLWLRAEKGRDAIYFIKDDGDFRQSTGTGDRRQAEIALAEYISTKNRPSGPLAADAMTCGQALSIYGEERGPLVADPVRMGCAIEALEPFWGAQSVSSVKGATCRRYEAWRQRASGTVRRELGVLQAALNHCAREGYLLSAPLVTLSAKGDPKLRWMTRTEAAWLLRGARHLKISGRHLTRFIRAGIYTGTRKEAILSLRINQKTTEGGWIDTEPGIMYRLKSGAAQTIKRQPTVRLPGKFLATVRRWAANGNAFVVQDYRGNRVGDIKKGWAGAIEKAHELAAAAGVELDLSDVTPHSMRHTAITWAMQRGADKWDVCGFFGISLEMLEKVYGHHHLDHQQSVLDAMDSRGFSPAGPKQKVASGNDGG